MVLKILTAQGEWLQVDNALDAATLISQGSDAYYTDGKKASISNRGGAMTNPDAVFLDGISLTALFTKPTVCEYLTATGECGTGPGGGGGDGGGDGGGGGWPYGGGDVGGQVSVSPVLALGVLAALVLMSRKKSPT